MWLFCEAFARVCGDRQPVSGAIRFFHCAIFALDWPIYVADSRERHSATPDSTTRGRIRMKDMALWDEGDRSEEHTSELQSLMRISYDVFCLKKKKTQQHKRRQKK